MERYGTNLFRPIMRNYFKEWMLSYYLHVPSHIIKYFLFSPLGLKEIHEVYKISSFLESLKCPHLYMYIPHLRILFHYFHVTFWYVTCKSFNSDISAQWRRFHSLQKGEGLSERPVDIRHIWKLFTFSRSKKESTSPKAWAILAFVFRWIEIEMNSGIKPILFLVLLF